MHEHEEWKFNCSGNDLAKVVWYYGLIENVSSGKDSILCPFHSDINPSMMVDFESGGFYCFGCQEAGDALKFVQKMEHKLHGANDLQGCKKYFEILKSNKVRDVVVTHKVDNKTKRELYEESYDYYHGLSKVDWTARSTSNEMHVAKEYMKSRGFSSRTLNECQAKVNYNRSYGIIFPMLDNGKFKGWVCRTWLPEMAAKRKYLYNKGFRRKTTLVGKYNNTKVIFVVEGFMDRLKFIQFGVGCAVAILGWKMSDEQIRKIKESDVEIIVSALDNDKCGKKGSAYLNKVFGDKYVRFQYIKGIKDPGEMDQVQFDKMYRKTMQIVNKVGCSSSVVN